MFPFVFPVAKPRLLSVLATGYLLLLSLLAAGPSAAGEVPSFSGATGGIVRFPNSLQPEDDGNLFGEAWTKAGVTILKTERGELSAFVLGNFVADSLNLSYNNTAKIGVGLAYSLQVNDALNVTFSARHDWFRERGTDVRRRGMRYAIDYYYYRYWPADRDEPPTGLHRRAGIFKSYGTLAYPGSLIEGDSNIVLTLGGEYSHDFGHPATNWLVTPFADFDFAWDRDGNNYNNKIIPGVGVKLRYPLSKGELFAGVRLSADHRWIDGTTDVGPGAFFGWYRGF